MKNKVTRTGLPAPMVGRWPSTRRLNRISWGLAITGLFLYLFPFRLLFGRDFSHWMEAHSDILIGTMLLFLALFLRVVWFEPGREAPE